MVIDGARYKIDLKKLLAKLGIKSAQVDPFEEMLLNVASNYGTPNQLLMDPTSYKKFVEAFGVKK